MNFLHKLKKIFIRHNGSSISFDKHISKKYVATLNTNDSLMYYGLMVEMTWLHGHIESHINRHGKVVYFEANALNRLLNKVVSDGTNAMGKDQYVPVVQVLNEVILFIESLQNYGCKMKSGKESYYEEVFVRLDLIKKSLLYFGVDQDFMNIESIRVYSLPIQRFAQ